MIRPSARFQSLLLLAILAGGAACQKSAVKRARPRGEMVKIKTDRHEFFIDRYEYPNQKGKKPRHSVVFDDARAQCARQGKRLCTDWEWRQACMGAQMTRIFPYGPTYQDGRCLTGSVLQSGHSGMTRESNRIAASGAHEGCKTPDGIYDMVGNLEEWVLSRWNGMHGILEGGAWFTIQRYASCTGNYSRQPQYRINLRVPVFSAGFRCCWSRHAPTEAELSLEELALDTTLRLGASRGRASKEPYLPGPEVQLSPGTFIDKFEYPNREGEYPLVGVSWDDADKRCKAAGKRLCHVEEWERACAGKSWLSYPYGDHYIPETCAVEEGGPLRAGERAGCSSASGARDMSGGVWEWTADKMDAPIELYEKGKVLRHVRGGSWYVNAKDATCRPEVGYPTAPQYSVFTDLGFRCCRGVVFREKVVAEPGTATCPGDMVAIKDFCVDRYEFPNQKGEPPLHNLNFKEATSACKSVGLHVCTGVEWMAACSGANKRTWSYGYNYDPDRCHYGLVPNNDNNVAVCGSKPECKTPEGIFDMSGVHHRIKPD